MARLDQLPSPQAAEGARGFSLPGTLAQRWNACLVAACGLVVLLGGYAHRWTNDDALIYTRAVRQVLAGNGPVYNIGERAESSTGTLWQWLLVAGSAVPGVDDPLRLAVALGLPLTVAGYVLALDGTRRLWRLRRPSGALLPAGVLALLPLRATWDYATSGLETGLSFGWLGLCWWLLVRSRGGWGRPAAVAFVFGLGPLVRPDLTLVTVVFLAALWAVRRPSARTAGAWACAALALPLAYEVFRAGYYGVLVPLPAIAKEASGTQWQYGFDYLRNTLVPYYLWVPLLLLAAFGIAVAVRARHQGQGRGQGPGQGLRDRARQADVALVTAPVLAGLLSAFFVVKVGGDFMHGRMVLPALFLVLLPVALLPYGRWTGVLAAALGAWAVACAALCRPPVESPEPRIVYDSHKVYVHGLGHPHPTSQAVHTAHDLPVVEAVRAARHAHETRGARSLVLETVYDAQYPALPLAPRVRAPLAVAEARLGNAGAVLPLDGLAVDTLGLANPLGAHTLPTVHFKAGHEKPLDRAWIVADLTRPGTPLPAYVDPLGVRAARHALTCGPLAELQESVRAPMTPERFLRNLAGSWSRTQFRIPADPVEAERQLCDGA